MIKVLRKLLKLELKLATITVDDHVQFALRKKITFQIKISFQLKSNYQKYLIELFYRPLSIVEKDDIILE